MPPNRFSVKRLASAQTFWVAMSLLAALVLFGVSVDGFATTSNLLASARNVTFIALIAVGATVVIMSGGIDLSVGSVMGLSAVVTASVMQAGSSAIVGTMCGLGTGILCGLVNGALITYLRLSPFVVTLGMLSIARSLAVVLSNNKTLFELGPDQTLFLAIGSARPAPIIVLFVTLVVLSIIMQRTPWGRYVYALGGNEEAAHRTGIAVHSIKLAVYATSGLLAGISGILMVAWLGSVSSSLGTGYELTAVAAAVIGGTQLSGGYGSLVGSVIGAALLEVIRNGLTLSGINPYWQGAFVGTCIIVAVVIDSLKQRCEPLPSKLFSRQILMPLVAAALVVVATLLVRHQPRPSTKTFAVVPKFMNHPFFEQAKQGCEAAARELADTTCLFIGPNEPSEQVQIQILQDLVTRAVDGIAVAPANSAAAGRILTLARDAKIPVVTWDSDLLPEAKPLRHAYIGTQNYQLGTELGTLLATIRPQGGTLAMLSGGAAAENLNERMQGVRDALRGKGYSEVAGTPLYCNDDSALAIQQLEDILGKYPNLNAVVSLGAWPLSVQHAYQLLAEKHKQRIDSGELIILSADTLPMQLELVRQGFAHGLVGQRPFSMGYKVMHALNDIRLGHHVEDPSYTGLDICTGATIQTCVSSTHRSN